MRRRNPIAKAVTRIRPQVIPDKRDSVLTEQALLEAKQALGDNADRDIVVVCIGCLGAFKLPVHFTTDGPMCFGCLAKTVD